MSDSFRVNNVDGAIELASSFKDKGKYAWFRGQVKPWAPHSSSRRKLLAGEDEWQKSVVERLARFGDWVEKTPGLEAIHDPEALLAVAQHYGIPTDFIDFTTDPGVAGFFACDTKTPEIGADSCIYCLDPDNLLYVWDLVRTAIGDKDFPEIKRLTPSVPNLWRLEAQKGVFLECGVNWEVHYPMDKIVFPYTGYPAYPTRDYIYPSRKSPLEILLDQHFMNEKLLIQGEELREWFRQLKNPNKHSFVMSVPPERTHAEFFVDGNVPILDSWTKEQLNPWLRIGTEFLRDVDGPIVRLAISSHKSTSQERESISAGVRRAIVSDPSLRNKSVNWVLLDPASSAVVFDPNLSKALDWLWDGMRNLPYSDEAISGAVANCVLLHQRGLRNLADQAICEAICKEIFGDDVIQLQFGAIDGSYSEGFCIATELELAIRPDMRSLIKPEHREQIADSLKFLLQIISAPHKIFDFQLLTSIFASQLIPTQVLCRTGQVVYFSPARLNGLGHP